MKKLTALFCVAIWKEELESIGLVVTWLVKQSRGWSLDILKPARCYKPCHSWKQLVSSNNLQPMGRSPASVALVLWARETGGHERFHIFVYIYIYICLCIYHYLSLSIIIYHYLSICLSIYLSSYLYICLSVYLSIYLSICLSVWLSVYLSVCIYAHMYILPNIRLVCRCMLHGRR